MKSLPFMFSCLQGVFVLWPSWDGENSSSQSAGEWVQSGGEKSVVLHEEGGRLPQQVGGRIREAAKTSFWSGKTSFFLLSILVFLGSLKSCAKTQIKASILTETIKIICVLHQINFLYCFDSRHIRCVHPLFSLMKLMVWLQSGPVGRIRSTGEQLSSLVPATFRPHRQKSTLWSSIYNGPHTKT